MILPHLQGIIELYITVMLYSDIVSKQHSVGANKEVDHV